MKITKCTYALWAFATIFILAGATSCQSQGAPKTGSSPQGASQTSNTPQQQNTIDFPGGGKIMYGTVNGVTTQAAAMGSELKWVHQVCGEKPQVGNVFRVRGSNSVAVFFTVTDHNQGNEKFAGEVIAFQAAPNDIEGALVTDDAARFNSTINPMLSKLFSVWNPGGVAAPSSGATGAKPASASGPPASANAASATGSAVALHQVTLPDSTASVSIPAGWTVDPQSRGGTMMIHGTHGEVVILGNMFLAVDPSALKGPVKPLKGQIVYPSNVDPVKSFADLIQQFRKSNNMGPAPIQIQSAEQVAPPSGAEFQGERCAQATGQVNPDGKGMQGMFRVICVNPGQFGDFSFLDYVAEFPMSEAGQGNAMAAAIMNSFNVNMALVSQRAAAEAAPHIAQLKQVDAQQRAANQAFTANAINNIHAIGAAATARMNSTEAANSAEAASFNQHENDISRNGQGFSNYLLDQSVVQNNQNNTHSTQWNSQADAMVKSNPNRYEIVNTPNYWQGVDF